ncbi:MAG: hypothetical protein M0P93_01740 [Candidatus Cloacimonetes bacterium]|nr:hypothetical protein [Candidatus Cloacimonadota bacterium]
MRRLQSRGIPFLIVSSSGLLAGFDASRIQQSLSLQKSTSRALQARRLQSSSCAELLPGCLLLGCLSLGCLLLGWSPAGFDASRIEQGLGLEKSTSRALQARRLQSSSIRVLLYLIDYPGNPM